jgi:methylmalonyl-CoA mutase cobalamin-binding domain/chain
MPDAEAHLTTIRQAVIDGDQDEAVARTRAALDEGVSARQILDDGLTKGADEVGELFEKGEYFLPQLMLTGIALKAAMEVVIPVLKEQQESVVQGVVVMATIQSDVHDIGKNLVSSMLSAAGFQVHDIGVDVPIDQIIDKAIEVDADIIGCSALLTTSAPYLKDLVSTLEARGSRDQFKVIIGGASVTKQYAAEIGSDGTAADAVGAVRLAKRLIGTGEA